MHQWSMCVCRGVMACLGRGGRSETYRDVDKKFKVTKIKGDTTDMVVQVHKTPQDTT